jgi:hypothetical protein
MLIRRGMICRCAVIGSAFLWLTGSLRSQEKQFTASDVIERIKQHVGVAWQAETVDTFKAGNPDTPVTTYSNARRHRERI